MKKTTVLLSFFIILTIALVACNDGVITDVPDTSAEETTSEIVTDAPTTDLEITELETEAPTTEAVTTDTEAVSTDAATTETVTTEPATTEAVTTSVPSGGGSVGGGSAGGSSSAGGGGSAGGGSSAGSGGSAGGSAGGGGSGVPATPVNPCANGHDHDAVVTQPTCTAKGYTTYTCHCGDSYVADEVAALGHSYNNGVITTEPTCTEKGVKTYTCGACGDTYTEEVGAIGHAHNAVVTVPTCTAKGYTTYTCHCGDSYVADEVAALGHSFGEWVVTKEPTEAATGEKRLDCANCDHFETDVIAELAHDHSRWEQTTLSAVAPTCTATGLTEGKKCSECGETLVAQEIVPANGHDHDAVVTRPTCTAKGYTTYTCHCGDSYVADEVAALGHTEVIDAAVDATCATAGKTAGKHCSVCNEVLVAQETVAALGHTWTDATCTTAKTCSVCHETEGDALGHGYGSVVTVPTCTTKGYTTYTCDCGDGYVADEVSALGHTEVVDAAVGATCTTTGLTEGKHCSVCDEILVNQNVIDALGHIYGDDLICDVCSDEKSLPHRVHTIII